MNLSQSEVTPFDTSVPLTPEDESIRALLLHIAKSLVPIEGAVTVRILRQGEVSTATMITTSEHLGRLVGEQGRIARSIRTILTAAAMRMERRYTLDIKAIVTSS